MARGVNKAIIVGHLGADPETRYTPSGTAVCNIRVATTEAWNDRQSGEQREQTEWHRVVAFQRLAEIMGQYLAKGSQVYIEGKLQTRKWQDQQGNDRFTTEIVARDMQMLGGRQQQGGHPNAPAGQPSQPQGGGGAPGGGGGPAQPAGGSRPAGGDDTGHGGPPPDDFDDDIPF